MPDACPRRSVRQPTIMRWPVRARAKSRRSWSPEEIAREEQATAVRAERDRQKTPEERLEETLRLSRFISELRQGTRGDVRAR